MGGATGPDSSRNAVVEQYESVYGGYSSWNYETWASLGNALRGRWADTRRCWAFQNAGFMLPPENSITEEQTREIALSAVQLEYTVADNPICCMDGETPIWKVETKTKRLEDSGSGRYSAIWLVEIDCMTGEVRDKREFVVGSDMDALS